MSEEADKNFFADVNKTLHEEQEWQDTGGEEEAELLDENFGDEDDAVVGEPEKELETVTPDTVETELGPATPDNPAEQKLKRKQEILIALGFEYYDNHEKGVKYSMHVCQNKTNIKLGKTFKPNGSHFWWAFNKDLDATDKDRMLNPATLAKIPMLRLYNEILNGASEIPAKTITGHITKRVGKSVVIEFESPESWEEKGARFGEGALKFDVNGQFVPKSYSAETRTQPAKMKVPRAIRLPDYEREMASVEKTEKSRNGHDDVTPPPKTAIPIVGDIGTEEDSVGITEHKQAIIDKAALNLSACTQAAKVLVDQNYNDIELSDGEKGKIRHAIAATILIQSSRGGL